MCAASVESDATIPPPLLDRLREAGRLLLLTHIHPDGDGLGSMAALASAARAAGKTVYLHLPEGAPQRYAALLGGEAPACADAAGDLADAADAIVVLDTSALSQLTASQPVLDGRRAKTLVVDHHLTGDAIADVAWVDTSASACGVMTLELIEALGWPIDTAAAEALAAAITSDTGWMRFENTDARTLRAMADLLARGVRPDRLYERLYLNDRPQRLALTARALQSIELHAGGRIGTMQLLRGDFAATDARPDETENVVNELLRIGSVEVAIMLIENTDTIRVNLRSRGSVDVAAIARRFGGGGHARAAGLRSTEPVETLTRHLVEAAAEAV